MSVGAAMPETWDDKCDDAGEIWGDLGSHHSKLPVGVLK
jgi:hypothetical protein